MATEGGRLELDPFELRRSVHMTVQPCARTEPFVDRLMRDQIDHRSQSEALQSVETTIASAENLRQVLLGDLFCD